MGLDTTHDCWHGAYSAFSCWRHKLAEVAGIQLEAMEGYTGGGLGIPWNSLKPDILHVLLDHSDCDGIIEHAHCAPLADRLEELLPLLPDNGSGGHIRNWRDTTRQFISGLRLAHEKGEDVEFH